MSPATLPAPVPFVVGEAGAVAPTNTSQTLDVCVKAQVLNGTWETFGADRAVSVLPETLVFSGNEWGPDKASFVLRRYPWASWPDLQPFTPIEIEVGGVICWIGRTGSTPLKGGAEQSISVQCEGWQYHLDDNLYKRTYVHSALTDWKDIRSHPEANLAFFVAAPQVQAEAGSIALSFANGSTVTTNTGAGVYLDLGPESTAAAISVAFAGSTFAATFYEVICRCFASMAELLSVGDEGFTGDPATITSPHIATFSTPARYVALFVVRRGANGEENADRTIKMPAISVFTSTSYESGGESTLKATAVAVDAVERATDFISSDFSQVASSEDEFDIPTLVMPNWRSAREMIEGVNAYHDWTTQVDLLLRLVFEPRSSEPLLEVGSWSGEDIEDASAGDGSEIYDRVIVEGADASGGALDVVSEEGGNVVTKQGFHRAKAIGLSNATTTPVAEQVGATFVQSHQVTPYAGSVRAMPGSVRTVIGGQPVHPSLLARHCEELLRVSHMIDPNTGGVGRDGRMVGVAYTHATQSAEVSLDSRLDNFSALVARLALQAEVGA